MLHASFFVSLGMNPSDLLTFWVHSDLQTSLKSAVSTRVSLVFVDGAGIVKSTCVSILARESPPEESLAPVTSEHLRWWRKLFGNILLLIRSPYQLVHSYTSCGEIVTERSAELCLTIFARANKEKIDPFDLRRKWRSGGVAFRHIFVRISGRFFLFFRRFFDRSRSKISIDSLHNEVSLVRLHTQHRYSLLDSMITKEMKRRTTAADPYTKCVQKSPIFQKISKFESVSAIKTDRMV